MGGKGFAPKDEDKKARRNKDPIPTRRLRFKSARQPRLPAKMPGGELWPRQTREWWKRWARSPQSERFTALEWDYMLDTAVLHGQLWRGDTKVAAELRLRLAKFGPTPEDMQRLRQSYDTGPSTGADAAEVASSLPKGATARERYGDLKVLPGGQSSAGA